MTKLQAHRGVSSECPENTMPAFLLAIEQGYSAIELDPIVTKDLQVILHHDKTINRTGRHNDGSIIEEELFVADLTYQQILAYDFGLWKHPKFAGTKAPLLSEILPIARENGIQLKIDAKIFLMTEEHKKALFDLIRDWQDVAALSTKTVEDTIIAHELFPDMQVHYGGPTNESTLEALKNGVAKEKLNIWLPYPNKRTSYAQVPGLTKELAALAKKYGKLGVWNLADESEYEIVKTMGVYMAETNGEVKPVKNIGVLSDMHTHSDHSHDAKYPMPEIYASQREKGVKIMAIADHYDGFFLDDGPYSYQHITDSNVEADAITAQYNGDGMVLRGIELGEGFWHPEETKKVIADHNFDVVVGAIHAVKCSMVEGNTGLKRAFSQLKYDELTVKQVYELVDKYYDDNLKMVESTDIDICAHLTCVVGYFLSRHKIYVGVHQFEEKIRKILQVMIDKGIALEFNCGGYPRSGQVSPHLWIVQMYRDMGGYLITMASDAHSPGGAASGFDECVPILKQMGFKHVFYYKDRKPVQCTLV